jgi:hypothetical protein
LRSFGDYAKIEETFTPLSAYSAAQSRSIAAFVSVPRAIHLHQSSQEDRDPLLQLFFSQFGAIALFDPLLHRCDNFEAIAMDS